MGRKAMMYWRCPQQKHYLFARYLLPCLFLLCVVPVADGGATPAPTPAPPTWLSGCSPALNNNAVYYKMNGCSASSTTLTVTAAAGLWLAGGTSVKNVVFNNNYNTITFKISDASTVIVGETGGSPRPSILFNGDVDTLIMQITATAVVSVKASVPAISFAGQFKNSKLLVDGGATFSLVGASTAETLSFTDIRSSSITISSASGVVAGGGMPFMTVSTQLSASSISFVSPSTCGSNSISTLMWVPPIATGVFSSTILLSSFSCTLSNFLAITAPVNVLQINLMASAITSTSSSNWLLFGMTSNGVSLIASSSSTLKSTASPGDIMHFSDQATNVVISISGSAILISNGGILVAPGTGGLVHTADITISSCTVSVVNTSSISGTSALFDWTAGSVSALTVAVTGSTFTTSGLLAFALASVTAPTIVVASSTITSAGFFSAISIVSDAAITFTTSELTMAAQLLYVSNKLGSSGAASQVLISQSTVTSTSFSVIDFAGTATLLGIQVTSSTLVGQGDYIIRLNSVVSVATTVTASHWVATTTGAAYKLGGNTGGGTNVTFSNSYVTCLGAGAPVFHVDGASTNVRWAIQGGGAYTADSHLFYFSGAVVHNSPFVIINSAVSITITSGSAFFMDPAVLPFTNLRYYFRKSTFVGSGIFANIPSNVTVGSVTVFSDGMNVTITSTANSVFTFPAITTASTMTITGTTFSIINADPDTALLRFGSVSSSVITKVALFFGSNTVLHTNTLTSTSATVAIVSMIGTIRTMYVRIAGNSFKSTVSASLAYTQSILQTTGGTISVSGFTIRDNSMSSSTSQSIMGIMSSSTGVTASSFWLQCLSVATSSEPMLSFTGVMSSVTITVTFVTWTRDSSSSADSSLLAIGSLSSAATTLLLSNTFLQTTSVLSLAGAFNPFSLIALACNYQQGYKLTSNPATWGASVASSVSMVAGCPWYDGARCGGTDSRSRTTTQTFTDSSSASDDRTASYQSPSLTQQVSASQTGSQAPTSTTSFSAQKSNSRSRSNTLLRTPTRSLQAEATSTKSQSSSTSGTSSGTFSLDESSQSIVLTPSKSRLSLTAARSKSVSISSDDSATRSLSFSLTSSRSSSSDGSMSVASPSLSSTVSLSRSWHSLSQEDTGTWSTSLSLSESSSPDASSTPSGTLEKSVTISESREKSRSASTSSSVTASTSRSTTFSDSSAPSRTFSSSASFTFGTLSRERSRSLTETTSGSLSTSSSWSLTASKEISSSDSVTPSSSLSSEPSQTRSPRSRTPSGSSSHDASVTFSQSWSNEPSSSVRSLSLSRSSSHEASVTRSFSLTLTKESASRFETESKSLSLSYQRSLSKSMSMSSSVTVSLRSLTDEDSLSNSATVSQQKSLSRSQTEKSLSSQVSDSASRLGSRTASLVLTLSPSFSAQATASRSDSVTLSNSVSVSLSESMSRDGKSWSDTSTDTSSDSSSISESDSPSRSSTISSSATESASHSLSSSEEETTSTSGSLSSTDSDSCSRSYSQSASITPTTTETNSSTPTESASSEVTFSKSVERTRTKAVTLTASMTDTHSNTDSNSNSDSYSPGDPSASRSITETPSRLASSSDTTSLSTSKGTKSRSVTSSVSRSPSATLVMTPTPSVSPVISPTRPRVTPTATSTLEWTNSLSITSTSDESQSRSLSALTQSRDVSASQTADFSSSKSASEIRSSTPSLTLLLSHTRTRSPFWVPIGQVVTYQGVAAYQSATTPVTTNLSNASTVVTLLLNALTASGEQLDALTLQQQLPPTVSVDTLHSSVQNVEVIGDCLFFPCQVQVRSTDGMRFQNGDIIQILVTYPVVKKALPPLSVAIFCNETQVRNDVVSIQWPQLVEGVPSSPVSVTVPEDAIMIVDVQQSPGLTIASDVLERSSPLPLNQSNLAHAQVPLVSSSVHFPTELTLVVVAYLSQPPSMALSPLTLNMSGVLLLESTLSSLSSSGVAAPWRNVGRAGNPALPGGKYFLAQNITTSLVHCAPVQPLRTVQAVWWNEVNRLAAVVLFPFCLQGAIRDASMACRQQIVVLNNSRGIVGTVVTTSAMQRRSPCEVACFIDASSAYFRSDSMVAIGNDTGVVVTVGLWSRSTDSLLLQDVGVVILSRDTFAGNRARVVGSDGSWCEAHGAPVMLSRMTDICLRLFPWTNESASQQPTSFCTASTARITLDNVSSSWTLYDAQNGSSINASLVLSETFSSATISTEGVNCDIVRIRGLQVNATSITSFVLASLRSAGLNSTVGVTLKVTLTFHAWLNESSSHLTVDVPVTADRCMLRAFNDQTTSVSTLLVTSGGNATLILRMDPRDPSSGVSLSSIAVDLLQEGSSGAITEIFTASSSLLNGMPVVIGDLMQPAGVAISLPALYALRGGEEMMLLIETFTLISFAAPLHVPLESAAWSVTGCPLDVFPNTALCAIYGGDVIVIQGAELENVSGVTVIFPQDQRRMQPVACTIQSVNTTTVECVLQKGFGVGGSLVLTDPSDRVVAVLLGDAVSFSPWLECPRDRLDDPFCSGNGECDMSSGRCVCFQDGQHGFWTGANCTTCDPRYANSVGCTIPCPLDSIGRVCSDRGVCQSGSCVCDVGVTGDTCEGSCGSLPGASPCNGHGTCDFLTQQCQCSGSPLEGYWSPASKCSLCLDGWGGSRCSARCPSSSSGVICSGHGLCDASTAACVCQGSYCGSSCDLLGVAFCTNNTYQCSKAALYGPQCSQVCPGSNALLDTVCNQRGHCDNGALGLGICSCDDPYGLSDCSGECPTSGGLICSGHGKCNKTTAGCDCDSGFAGYSCSLQCPMDNSSNVCSGHGTCNDGHFGDGHCVCEATYSGRLCESTCINPTGPSCGGHGVCLPSGKCLCNDDPIGGHWSTDNCSSCLDGWFGSFCLASCAVATNGRPCSGHGTCDARRIVCNCYQDVQRGFWSGLSCDQCTYGYFGSNCTSRCPGVGCDVCNGNGLCNSGVNGTGACVCFASNVTGYWSGLDCTLCASGCFGPQCVLQCPVSQSSSALSCGGHGRCSDGIDGNGACRCDVGYNGTNCDVCAVGYFGMPNCAMCPTSVRGVSCSGHGLCNVDGRCVCDVGFGGTSCNWMCPPGPSNSVGALQSCGFGTCVGNNTCSCAPHFAVNTLTLSCVDCVVGNWGVNNCSRICPKCVHGICNQVTGECDCFRGYWGSLCANACPGGVTNPCSGHGVCGQTSGVCTCFLDAFRGFWANTECSTCAVTHLSTNCTVACPLGVNGTVCSGRGTCFNGLCSGCAASSAVEAISIVAICGNACDRTNEACFNFSHTCPAARWGPGCASWCPAIVGNAACSSHGVCDVDFGTCHCAQGYAPPLCNTGCALGLVDGVAIPCSGRGQCVNNATRCLCRAGYWGASCHEECPGGAANPCSGRGTCDAASGVCTCTSSAYGTDCSLPCPGGFDAPCSLRGTCTTTGTCMCYSTAALGFYRGKDCSVCQEYFTGDNCNVSCSPAVGTVAGRQCICSDGYVGSDCLLQCPRDDRAHLICGGRGVCVATLTGAACQCDDNWYGASCTVFCTSELCKTTQNLQRPQCNAKTGACECLDDSLRGHFAGAACDKCQALYWGAECNLLCPCNLHGSCDPVTGECHCFQSDGLGHWAGPACQSCAPGFVGIDCATQNAEFSVANVVDIPIENIGFPHVGIVFRDPITQLVWVGSSPLGVFYAEDWGTGKVTSRGLFVVPRPVSAFAVLNRTHVAFLLTPTDATQVGERVVVPRNISSAQLLTPSSQPLARSMTSQGVAPVLQSLEFAFDAISQCYGVINTTLPVPTLHVVCDGHGEVSLDNATLPQGDVVWFDFSGEFLFVSMVSTLATSPSRWYLFGFNSTGRLFNCSVALAEVMVSSGDGPLELCSVNANHAGCGYISNCLHVIGSQYVHCAASLRATQGIVIFRLALSSPKVVDQSVAPLQLSNVANVSATATDDSYSFALLACIGTERASLVRISLPGTKLISQMDLGRFFGDSITALRMAVNSTTRTLWLSLGTSLVVRAAAVNLFSITAVHPAVIDQSGGTVVTFKGIGLIASPPPLCVFSESDPGSPGIYRDNETLLCTASATRLAAVGATTSEVCMRIAVNVKYGNRTTATTTVLTSRPPSASVANASTPMGGVGRVTSLRSSYISLAGYGFVDGAEQSTCRIEGPTGIPIATLQRVIFINSSSVACYFDASSPGLPAATSAGTIIRYSHDGFVYSATGAMLVVVGAFSGLEAGLRDPSSTSLSAAQLTSVPLILVYKIDRNGNRLLKFDEDTTVLRIASRPSYLITDYASSVAGFAFPDALRNLTVEGVATFDSLVLTSPSVGILSLYAFNPSDLTMMGQLDVRITAGQASYISLASPTTAWIAGVSTSVALNPPPVLVVCDAAGNAISDTSRIPPKMEIDFWISLPSVVGLSVRQQQFGRTNVDGDGKYAFSGVSLRTTFGNPVTLRFTAENITNPFAVTVRTEKCLASLQYAVVGTFACASCPAASYCDGSETIMPPDGYWRGGARSAVLYPCDPPEACVGGTSTCAAGYQGALCGSCADGYGRSGAGCAPCLASTVNWGVTSALVVVVAIVVYLLSVRNIPFTSRADVLAGLVSAPSERSPVAILVKIALSHLQLLGLIPYRTLSLPNWVSSFLAGGGQASSFSPNLSFVACAVGNGADNSLILSSLLAPILLAVFSGVALTVATLAHRRFRNDSVQKLESLLAEKTKKLKASPCLYSDVDRARIAVSCGNDDDDDDVRGEVEKCHADFLEWYEGDRPNDLPIQGPPPSKFLELRKLFGRDKLALLRPPPIWERFVNVFLVSATVVLFFLYPTIVNAAVQALQCQLIDYGDGTTTTVMKFDPVVDCASSAYSAAKGHAIMVMIFVGVGVPLFCPTAVMTARRWTCGGDHIAATQLFFFATGGYRLWFWESISLARKALVAAVVGLASSGQPQLVGCAWVLGAFLALNVHHKPWFSPMLTTVDALSHATLASTFVLFAITQTDSVSSSDSALTASYALAISLNGLFFAAVAAGLTHAAEQQLEAISESNFEVREMYQKLQDASAAAKQSTLQREVTRVHDEVLHVQRRYAELSRVMPILEKDVLFLDSIRKCSVEELMSDYLMDAVYATLSCHPVRRSLRQEMLDVFSAGAADDEQREGDEAGLPVATKRSARLAFTPEAPPQTVNRSSSVKRAPSVKAEAAAASVRNNVGLEFDGEVNSLAFSFGTDDVLDDSFESFPGLEELVESTAGGSNIISCGDKPKSSPLDASCSHLVITADGGSPSLLTDKNTKSSAGSHPTQRANAWQDDLVDLTGLQESVNLDEVVYEPDLPISRDLRQPSKALSIFDVIDTAAVLVEMETEPRPARRADEDSRDSPVDKPRSPFPFLDFDIKEDDIAQAVHTLETFLDDDIDLGGLGQQQQVQARPSHRGLYPTLLRPASLAMMAGEMTTLLSHNSQSAFPPAPFSPFSVPSEDDDDDSDPLPLPPQSSPSAKRVRSTVVVAPPDESTTTKSLVLSPSASKHVIVPKVLTSDAFVGRGESNAKRLKRTIQNVRKAAAVWRGVLQIVPRRIFAAENHVESLDDLSVVLIQNFEAILSSEVVLLLSWLRLIRLWKEVSQERPVRSKR